MSTTYELWDFDSRNLVGVFESEEAALASVWEAYQEFGRDAAITLFLGRADDDGGGEELAAGDALIARARAHARIAEEHVGARHAGD